MFFVWIVILLTHLRFRQQLTPEAVAKLPLKLPAHPLPTIAGIAALAAIACSTFWVDGLQYTVPTFLPLLLVMSLVYMARRRAPTEGE